MSKSQKLSALTPDPRNANKGTRKGREALDKSIKDLGFGRSILVDSQGVTIAGNKTREAALAANPDQKVRVIETDGTELIVVKRTDLTLSTDAKAKQLAVADNRVAELDLSWDQDILAELGTEVDLSMFMGSPADAVQGTGEMEIGESAYKEQFGVIVLLTSAKEQQALFERFQKEGLTVRVVTT